MSVEDVKKRRRLRKPYAASYGGVAQLGEHLPCKQGVKGSNPFISTTYGEDAYGLIAQLVRARA